MPKTRERTEGNIFYRKSDCRYCSKLRKNEGGYKYIYGNTYAECEKNKREYIEYRDRYLSDIKLHVWLDDWYENFKKLNLKENSQNVIDVMIRVHIKRGLPNKSLSEINGLDLQKFLIGIVKSRTRRFVYDVLNESFRDALALRLIEYNPMLVVKIPVHHRKKGEALTKDEIKVFLKNIVGHKLEGYFKFLMYTGCRRNEALTLCAADVDFEKRLLHIRGTKTEKSNRIIPMIEPAYTLLNGMKLKDGVIFDFKPDYVTHAFKKYCPAHKLHDLRHTFATLCLEMGVSMKVVQVWLGHSNFDTTADIYSHVTNDYHAEEAKKLENFNSFIKKDEKND